jgi:hypothetical protein
LADSFRSKQQGFERMCSDRVVTGFEAAGPVTIWWSDRPGVGTHECAVQWRGVPDAKVAEVLGSARSGSVGTRLDDAACWTLTQAVASPLSATFDWSRLVNLYAYHPVDMEEILQFDRRITERYSEYWATAGEYYAGTWHCNALDSNWLVEAHGYDANEADAAQAQMNSVTPPDDVATIIDECRSLQQTDAPRVSVWLTPRR